MLQYDFDNSIGYWVTMAANAIRRAVNEELAPQAITYRQCQVLGWLALAGPLPQSELAERMGIEPPTLVGILDRMERDRWIRRKPCPTDGRKKLVHPTAAAGPVWSKIVAAARRVRKRATQGLSEIELAELKRMLERVQQNLQPESKPAACLSEVAKP